MPLPRCSSSSLAPALLVLLIVPAALPAFADEPATAFEEVVVVSSRIPLPLRRIGNSVSVIDADRIARHGNAALIDILRQQPAMALSNSGGSGQVSALRIRGEEGFRTLTLLDGLRLSDTGAPQVGPQLEHLLSSGIDRVEILRGPQGLAYGADAGGVVDLSTRRGSAGLQGTLDAQSGAFGTQLLAASAGGASALADFFVSAARLQTDGFNTLKADSRFADKDGYANDSAHLRGGLNLGTHWRVDAVHRHVAGETRYDNCFSPTGGGHDCMTRFDQQSSRLALAWSGNSSRHSVSWQRNDTQRASHASGRFAFGAEGELERWEYSGSSTALPGFDLVFGADQEQALNNGEGRANTGAYAEILSDFSDALSLSAGLRHDANDDFGSNTSHRVSAAWLMEPGDSSLLKFKGSVGSGFRAPSPYEIQYNRGSWAYPPASLITLQQETSKGREAGVEYVQGNTLKLEAVWFDQDVADALTFDLVSWSGYLQEFGTSNSQGVELSAETRLGAQWLLLGNLTFNDTTRPNGQQRTRRPRQLYNLGLSWQGLDSQRLTLNAFVRGSRDSIDEVSGVPVALPDFAVLDLGARLRVGRHLQVYGRLENALGREYEEVAGYHVAGRAAYLGFGLGYGTP